MVEVHKKLVHLPLLTELHLLVEGMEVLLQDLEDLEELVAEILVVSPVVVEERVAPLVDWEDLAEVLKE